MSRRRRGSGPGIVTIYWRDIPAQITVTTAAGETEKVLLEPRFQHAIDRAAHAEAERRGRASGDLARQRSHLA